MTGSQEATRFTSAEQDVPPDAPRLHWGALAALFLGVASALAPLGMGFWIIPAAAITTALYALFALRRQDIYRGSRLALVGLGLALLFLSFAVTRQVYLESLLEARSGDLARQWLDLVLEDRMLEAHHLTLQRPSRVSGEALAGYYENEEHQRGLKMLSNQNDILPLRGTKAKAQVEHRGSQLAQIGKDFEQYAHQFRIRPGPGGKVVDTKIIVERQKQGAGAYWRITSTSGIYRVAE